MKKFTSVIAFLLYFISFGYSQNLPSSIIMKDIPAGTMTMGSNSLQGSPTQQAAAPEHQVTLSAFAMSEAEITNAQYIEFLNSAFGDGLIEIVTGVAGPDSGKQLVQGTNQSTYSGKVLYTLDGTRVMKDHDNADGDANEFTGDIEPENPLNTSYIGFNASTQTFYIKNPHDINDFDWASMCNYQDYSSTPMQLSGPILNDFADWSGAGQNFSNELQNWTPSNPANATNLPTQSEVALWPVTFIRWWGAKAFAEYYGATLPTEAQWEYAAKAGQNYQWATYNGVDNTEANWNQLGMGTVATGHVRASISGTANPFGIYNLAGNCWEWIADNYVAPYDLAAVTDPLIEVSGSTSRSWRGGAWNYHEATLQSSIRFYDDENKGNDHFGFRITSSSSTSSIKKLDSSSPILLYPNPSSNQFFVTYFKPTPVELRVYSAEGMLVLQKTFSGKTVLNSSDWQKGVYLIRIEESTYRLIKN